MELQISDQSRRAATECTKGFSCLTGERKDLCVVENCINGQVYFIKCLQDGGCAYRIPFGMNHLCLCPVRKELFNEYKI